MHDVVAILLALAAVICFTDGLLYICAHLGHWARLAEYYPAHYPPAGPARYFESAQLGWLGYNNGLTLRLAPEGLYLAMPPWLNFGHRPMLLPWEAMRVTEKTGFLGRRGLLTLGDPPVGTVTLRWPIIEEARRLGYLSIGAAPEAG